MSLGDTYDYQFMNTTSDIYFSSVLNYLSQKGLCKQTCLQLIGFSEFKEKVIGDRVSLIHYQALLELGKQNCEDPLFGFHLGQDIRTADYGVLGYLIESSRDLAAAIDSLLHYDTLVADIGTANFSYNKQIATICWTPKNQCSEQVVLRNMTAWVAVVRHLLDPDLAPKCLHFVHPFTKLQLHQLSNWFGCDVKGGMTSNKIDFPHDYLQFKFSSDNPIMHHTLTQLSKEQLTDIQSGQRVSQRVMSILMSKQDLHGVNQPIVANALNLTPRTLQRKLKREHCTFAHLLDQERKRRYALLADTLSLGEIAAVLGFNEQSSFNRAFKRWYGCAPNAFSIHYTQI